MLIDWFTVAAQIINFLILMALLKRFLYKPLIEAMDRREQKIAEQIRRAGQARQRAEREARALREERLALRDEREKLLARAGQEVRQWKQEALAHAGEEVSRQQRHWLGELEREKKQFKRDLKIRVSSLILEVADKVLVDLADSTLESRLIETFINKLETGPGRDELGTGPHNATPITIVSGFEISPAPREKLQAALAALPRANSDVCFSVDTDLGFGLIVKTGDRKIEWSLARYLHDLEDKIFRELRIASGARI